MPPNIIPFEPEMVPLLVMPPANVASVVEVPDLLANAATAMPVVAATATTIVRSKNMLL